MNTNLQDIPSASWVQLNPAVYQRPLYLKAATPKAFESGTVAFLNAIDLAEEDLGTRHAQPEVVAAALARTRVLIKVAGSVARNFTTHGSGIYQSTTGGRVKGVRVAQTIRNTPWLHEEIATFGVAKADLSHLVNQGVLRRDRIPAMPNTDFTFVRDYIGNKLSVVRFVPRQSRLASTSEPLNTESRAHPERVRVVAAIEHADMLHQVLMGQIGAMMEEKGLQDVYIGANTLATATLVDVANQN